MKTIYNHYSKLFVFSLRIMFYVTNNQCEHACYYGIIFSTLFIISHFFNSKFFLTDDTIERFFKKTCEGRIINYTVCTVQPFIPT